MMSMALLDVKRGWDRHAGLPGQVNHLRQGVSQIEMRLMLHMLEKLSLEPSARCGSQDVWQKHLVT